MNKQIKRSVLSLTLALTLLAATFGGAMPSAPQVAASGKIDPYLQTMLAANPAGAIALIVKGNGQAALRSAIERYGGQVTADLWLVDSLAALVPADKVAALVADPAVLAVSPDKPVQKADGPGDRSAPNRLNGTFDPLGGIDIDPVADTHGNAYVFSSQSKTYKVSKISSTGAILWTYILGLGSSFEPLGGVVTPSDEFVVATAKKGLISLKTTGPVALPSWTYSGFDLEAAPQIAADGTIYFLDADNVGYALNPNGTRRWKRTLSKSSSGATPVPVPGGVVFLVGSGSKLDRAVYVAADNSKSWTWQARDNSLLGPVVDGAGRFILADGKTVVALNPADGSVAWQSAGLQGDVVSVPLLTSTGAVVVLVEGRGLFGLNGSSGATQWTASLRNVDDDSMVALAAGRYVGVGVDNTFYTFDSTNGAASGAPLTLDNNNDFRSLTTGASGFFYAYTAKNRFMLLAQDASLYWSYSLYVQDGANKPYQMGRDSDDEKLRRTKAPTDGSGLAVASDGTAFVVDSAERVAVLGVLSNVDDSVIPDVSDVDLLNSRMKLAYSAAIDTGADLVYRNGVTGRGVTVALIDSGVYYDRDMQRADKRTQYIGQVDMLSGSATPPISIYSTDPYGHGSHVASIIVNPLVDQLTNTYIGMAPDARLVSVRVLDARGQGSYSTVIAGLQWVVTNKAKYGIKIANYSIVGRATAPYWADPLDVAAAKIWQAGIVLLAAAGNEGPGAFSVSVPANSPYVIAVGALNGNRTAGKWGDDYVSQFSAAGPTLDGFVKPDVIAPGSRIVGFMKSSGPNAAYLATVHPTASAGYDFYRMSGTSQATAMVSGIAALVLQQNPNLTPDQVKYRLQATSMPFVNENGSTPYSIFQQGTGRIWAPAAVFAKLDNRSANIGMNLAADIGPAGGGNNAAYSDPQYSDTAWHAAHPQVTHYEGPASYDSASGKFVIANVQDPSADGSYLSWSGGYTNWAGGYTNWAGGYTNWAGGYTNWAGGYTNWAGGYTNWAGGYTNWAGGYTNWAGGYTNWAGGYTNWAGGYTNWAGGYTNWAGTYADPQFAADFADADNVPTSSSSASLPAWVGQ